MPFTLVRRPRSPNVLTKEIRDEVREAYRKLAQDIIDRLKNDIKSWDHQPEFRYKIAAGVHLWYINVSHDSQSEAGRIYNWVDKGTGENAGKGEKYPIYPKNVPALSFYVPNMPKSIPNIVGTGIPGIVISQGAMQQEHVLTKKVMHPGIRPRDFVKSMRDDMKQRTKVGAFRSVTEAAIKRGTRKIGMAR